MDAQHTRHGHIGAPRGHPVTLPPVARRIPAGTTLFDGLEPGPTAALLEAARVEEYAARLPLALGGAYPSCCWVVLEGHVKEHRRLIDGSDVVTGVRGPGDLVAEVAIQQAPSPVDVTAIEPVSALALDARRIRRLMEADVRIAAAVGGAIAERVLSTQRLLIRNGRSDSGERVVLALLDLAGRFGVDVPSGRWIGVPLSQTELASWVGMSRESFAKVLRRLRSKGLVRTSRRDIVLTDVDALRALAASDALVGTPSS